MWVGWKEEKGEGREMAHGRAKARTPRQRAAAHPQQDWQDTATSALTTNAVGGGRSSYPIVHYFHLVSKCWPLTFHVHIPDKTHTQFTKGPYF